MSRRVPDIASCDVSSATGPACSLSGIIEASSDTGTISRIPAQTRQRRSTAAPGGHSAGVKSRRSAARTPSSCATPVGAACVQEQVRDVSFPDRRPERVNAVWLGVRERHTRRPCQGSVRRHRFHAKASREPAPQQGNASAPAAPPISPAASSAAPPDVVASCWRTVAARWILPMAAAILLVAPSLVVGWHALRTRANVDNMEALTPPVVSATYAAHGVTPPPAGEELSAVMDRSGESDQESAVRRDLKSQGLDFQSCLAVTRRPANRAMPWTPAVRAQDRRPTPRGAERQWCLPCDGLTAPGRSLRQSRSSARRRHRAGSQSG
jgi:hypothetical protein